MHSTRKQHWQYYAQLLWVLAKTDFKLRYHGSILGFLWALLKPLLIFMILNFVFNNIFGAGVEYYSIKLLTGIMLWDFFSSGTSVGLTSLMDKAGIITKIYFPRWVIVVARTMSITLTFLISLAILAVFYLFYGVIPSLLYILLFAGVACMIYMMILIFSFLVAPVFLKLRDLNQIWEVLLTAGFYAAPIIYPLTAIPEKVRFLVYFNPMTFAIQWSKDLLIYHQAPSVFLYGGVILLLVILLSAAVSIFNHSAKHAAENI